MRDRFPVTTERGGFEQRRHDLRRQAVGIGREVRLAVVHAFWPGAIGDGAVGGEPAQLRARDLPRRVRRLVNRAEHQRRRRRADVPNGGVIVVGGLDDRERVGRGGAQRVGRIRAVAGQPGFKHRGIRRRLRIEPGPDRVPIQIRFATLRREPALSSERNVIGQFESRVGQVRQAAQLHVLLHRGHDAAAGAAEDPGAREQRLVGLERLASVGKETALFAVNAIRAGKHNAQHVPATAEDAVRRIEQRAHLPPILPDQPDVAVARLNRHEREGDLVRRGHLAFRFRADDVRFRTARFVFEILQSGEQTLAFACAEGFCSGDEQVHRQINHGAVLVHTHRRLGDDGPGGIGAECLPVSPLSAVHVAAASGEDQTSAIGLRLFHGYAGQIHPTHLLSLQITDARSRMAEGDALPVHAQFDGERSLVSGKKFERTCRQRLLGGWLRGGPRRP